MNHKDGKTLRPKCFPDFCHDQIGQQICLNHAGYFTPCCWFDDEAVRKNYEIVDKFFDPSLHIDNNEKVEDIVEGNFWKDFFEMLYYNPEKAPGICYKMCGVNIGEDHHSLITDTPIRELEADSNGTIISWCIRN